MVTLLKNTRGLSGEENLNASIEQLEFAFMEALHLLQQTETPRVAILEGHGEPDEAHTYDLMSALSKYFQVDRGSIRLKNEPTSSTIDDMPYLGRLQGGDHTESADGVQRCRSGLSSTSTSCAAERSYGRLTA